MKFLIATAPLFLAATISHAQTIKLQKLTTSDGKSADAAVYQVDSLAGTITILVPKTIPIDRLDSKSKLLALESINTPVEPTAIEASNETSAKVLTTVRQWKPATPLDRQLTSRTWLYSLLSKKMASDAFLENVATLEDFEATVQKVTEYCDEIVESGTLNDDQELTEWFALFVTTAKWAKSKDLAYIREGAMNDPTIDSWLAASTDQKNVTCGNIVLAVLLSGSASTEFKRLVKFPYDLNPLVDQLVKSVDETISLSPDYQKNNVKLSEVIGAIATKGGWFKSSTVIDGVRFSELKFVQKTDDWSLIGVITNETDKDIVFATFHFNFRPDSELAAVESLIVPGLKAGESKTFDTNLFDVDFKPDHQMMTIDTQSINFAPD